MRAKIQNVDFPYKKKLHRGVRRALGVACWVDRAKADKTYILNSFGGIVSHHGLLIVSIQMLGTF